MKSRYLKRIIPLSLSLLLIAAGIAGFAALTSHGKGTEDYNIISDADMLIKSDFSPIKTRLVLEGYQAVAEDEKNVLFVSEETANIAVMTKQSGDVLYTACTEEQSKEHKLGNIDASGRMMSSLYVDYSDKDGTVVNINSYEMSVVNKTFGISSAENGVEITYLMGKIPKVTVVPKAMTQKSYDRLMQQLGDSDKREFLPRYTKIDTNEKLTDSEKELSENYPESKNQVIYVLDPQIKEFILARLEGILEKKGYTAEDKSGDESEAMKGAQTETPPVIKASVCYTLENGDLVVKIDKSKIKYSPSMIPVNIGLNEFFLSGSSGQEGYMLVPDGSGSMIKLNNGKTSAAPFRMDVYGEDMSVKPTLKTETQINVLLPVFGIKLDDFSVFAHIEEGGAMAAINADIAGRNTKLNMVYPTFYVRRQMQEAFGDRALSGSSMMTNRIQPGELEGNYTVRYTIMEKGSGYNEMAALFRERLTQNKILTQKDNDKLPFVLDIVGAVDILKPVFGIPQSSAVAMTDFAQAGEIYNYFSEKEPFLRYTGSFGNGIKHSAAASFTPLSLLGGIKEFNELAQKAPVYIEASLAFAPQNTIFDRLNVSRDTIRFLNAKTGFVLDPDPPTYYYAENPRYALTPGKIHKVTKSFISDIKKYGAAGISPRYMGDTLISDCNEDSPVFRDRTEAYYREYLSGVKKENLNIISGGNYYMLGYSTVLVNVPVKGNLYRITDRSVPFYQMSVHGSTDYCGSPVNFFSNPDSDILKLIETGSGVSALLMFESSTIVKGTDYSGFYAANFDGCKKAVSDAYEKVSKALEGTNGAYMTGHEMLAENVFKTTYSNGQEIFVNYNSEDFKLDGLTVKGMNYLARGGETNE